MKKRFSVLLALLSFVCACVKFSPTEITRVLPSDIAERNNLIQTAQWREHLDELVGGILIETVDAQGTQQFTIGIRRFLKPNEKPVFRTYSESDGKLLEFIIDNKADAKLQILAFGGANIGAEQKMLFHYSDVSDVWLNDGQFDTAALRNEANQSTDPSIKNRWFIQGALLSTIQKKIFTKVQGGLNRTVTGIGFSAEGQIYHSTSTFTKDYAIHLTLRHLDLFRGTEAQVQQKTAYFVRRERPAEKTRFSQILRQKPLPDAELRLVLPEGLWIEKLKRPN